MNTPRTQTEPEDRFGQEIAARLESGATDLPHDIQERLRAARVQALARRKRVAAVRTAVTVSGSGGSATMTMDDEGQSRWNRIASFLPLLALAAGLILIHSFVTEWRANEIAEVDADLLTDDLPPDAYADPGFIQFLKQAHRE